MDLISTNEVTQSDVTAQCERCKKIYLVKYWDEELDWYIEMNLTSFCRQCQQEVSQETLVNAIDSTHSA
ncbi:MAG: hypothetical protein JSR17_11500 [Proteobacteria bacterium]|nr:hypothetical protein [Pseudomonadota bacterium]